MTSAKAVFALYLVVCHGTTLQAADERPLTTQEQNAYTETFLNSCTEYLFQDVSAEVRKATCTCLGNYMAVHAVVRQVEGKPVVVTDPQRATSDAGCHKVYAPKR